MTMDDLPTLLPSTTSAEPLNQPPQTAEADEETTAPSEALSNTDATPISKDVEAESVSGNQKIPNNAAEKPTDDEAKDVEAESVSGNQKIPNNAAEKPTDDEEDEINGNLIVQPVRANSVGKSNGASKNGRGRRGSKGPLPANDPFWTFGTPPDTWGSTVRDSNQSRQPQRQRAYLECKFCGVKIEKKRAHGRGRVACPFCGHWMRVFVERK